MRILILKALAEDHLYSVSSEALCSALNACGAEASTLAPRDDPSLLADALLSGRRHAVISFGSAYSDLRSAEGRSVYDILGVTFVGWHFDHPLYVSHAWGESFGARLSVYPNASHLRFLTEARVSGAAAVLLAGADAPTAPPPAFEERPWGVFVAATCDEDLAPFWETMPYGPARSLVAQFVERLSASAEVSVVDAFVQARNALGLQGLVWDQGLQELLRVGFTYVRRMDKVRAIEALVESGLPLTLCGSGWKDRFGDRAHVDYIDPVPFADLAPLYGRSKVSLNLNAANGGCERAMAAMLWGSCVVSDYSSALEATVGSGALRTFRRGRPETLVSAAGDLLESDAGATLAAAGRERALDSAQWIHRADALLKLLKA